MVCQTLRPTLFRTTISTLHLELRYFACKSTAVLLQAKYRNSRNFHITYFHAFNFAVIYYLQFQEPVNIHCSKSSFRLNFRVLNFCSFFQPQIINNRENFQNYGSVCTPAVLLQLLLHIRICPGERGIHTRTTSCALRPSLQVCDINYLGCQIFVGDKFVCSLTLEKFKATEI